MSTGWLIEKAAELLTMVGGTSVVLFFVLKHMMAPIDTFLAKKGENLATHQDIQMLVDQVRETERVKTEIADRMWDRQARWQFKKDTYVALVTSIAGLLAIENRFSVASEMKNNSELERAYKDFMTEWSAHQQLAAVAPLVVSNSAQATLRKLSSDAKSGKIGDDTRIGFYRQAVDKLHLIAKEDLGYS